MAYVSWLLINGSSSQQRLASDLGDVAMLWVQTWWVFCAAVRTYLQVVVVLAWLLWIIELLMAAVDVLEVD